MTTDIDNLLNALNNYLSGEGTLDQIEHATTPFILDDENKLQDKRLSEIIYQLDMHDVERLNRSDVENLRNELIKYREKSLRE